MIATSLLGLLLGVVIICISLLKIVDLAGFVRHFKEYDVIAMRLTWYAYTYPLVELLLGLGFLFHPNIRVPAFWTLVFTSINTVGILKAMHEKKKVHAVHYGIRTQLHHALWGAYLTLFLMIILLVFG